MGAVKRRSRSQAVSEGKEMKSSSRAAVISIVVVLSALALIVGMKAGNYASADISAALKEAKPRMIYFYAPW